jgi:hypothetical protein
LIEEPSTRFHLREGYALPDSQAGTLGEFKLRTFFAPDDHQSNSTDEREPSDDFGNGDPILRIRRDMHGPKIHDMFATGIGETLIGERQSSENYQDNASYRDWFHGF